MQLFYESRDITDALEIAEAIAADCEGGECDSLKLTLRDIDAKWPAWAPTPGDKLRLTHGAYTTGTMYLGDIEYRPGETRLTAYSLPARARVKHTQVWEDVSLARLITEFAARAGCTPYLKELPAVQYTWVGQFDEYDMRFLSNQCALEGLVLKSYNNALIVRPLARGGNAAAMRKIDLGSAVSFTRHISATARYNRCTVYWPHGDHEVMATCAPPEYGAEEPHELWIEDIPAYSMGEAGRYARGLLLRERLCADWIAVELELDDALIAGDAIAIVDSAGAANTWIISALRHDFIGGRTSIRLRRCVTW